MNRVSVWILIVVVAAGLFVAINAGLGGLSDEVGNQQGQDCYVRLTLLHQTLRLYRMKYSEYPPSGVSGLAHLREVVRDPNYDYSQLKERDLLDPWGRPFVYRAPVQPGPEDWKQGPKDLYSVGPNGIDESGHGDDVFAR